MSEYQHQHNDFPPQAPHPPPFNTQGANDEDQPGNEGYLQSHPFDHFHAPYEQFGLLAGQYEQIDYSGTAVNYQNNFPQVEFAPQGGASAPGEVQTSEGYAPAGFYNPQYTSQVWEDEIHPSYVPAGNSALGWTPTDSGSYAWLVDTIPGNPIHQPFYDHSPTNLPIHEYAPLDTSVTEALIAHRFLHDTASRSTAQQAISAEPVSVALKVRNEKFKKEFTTSQFEIADPNGYRPLRVSKAKKMQKMEGNNSSNGNYKQEACWRCKRYRKACIGQEVCKECSTAGFRVWPSAIGCRRGAMEGFVERLLPSHSIGVLRTLRVGVSRTSNWRKALCQPEETASAPGGTNPDDRWELLKIKVQSTTVFGSDFSALVDILAAYEKARQTEIPIWTQSITLLSSACEFYHFFVDSSSTEIPLPTLINATIKFRKALHRSWDLFLKFCLSGRRENWFPAFLTVVLGICSIVILMDSVPSVPAATRKAVWGDIEAVVKDLRVRQHMMSLDLLRIGAKGINPLKLDYWVAEEEIDEEGEKVLRRNAKGMALLGQDAAAFDGFIALREWHGKYKSVMREGSIMWDSVPYTLAHIQAIAALSRVFDF